MGALIPLGISLGTSLLGKALAGKPQQTPAQTTALSGLAQGQATGLSAGTSLLGQGQGAVSQPLNYWSSILSGNKSGIASALAPEIGQISNGYNAAANTSAALNPRGGPSSTFLADLPFQKQRDVSTLFQTARPQAASGLASVGQNLLSTGTGLLGTANAAANPILSQQQQALEQQQKLSSQIGSGLYAALQGKSGNDLTNAIKGLFQKSGATGGSGSYTLPGYGLPSSGGPGSLNS